MAGVQFGLVIPADSLNKANRVTYTADVNRALAMAAGHFDSAWIIDHVQFGDSDVLEGFTTLSYLAALHPRLTFGHAVLCQSFRNPALVAKMGATLHFLSGGRFVLGMGAGWHEEEYRAYGYEFPSGRVRVAQLDEALHIIKGLWTEDRFTFTGAHHRVQEAYCEPKPVPMPAIMVGAFRPKMLRLAARHADWWNVSSTGIDAYAKLVRACEGACADVGRDPATLRRTWAGGCACAPTEAEARALAAKWADDDDPDDFDFVGTPEQIVAQMRRFVALGVDLFILDCAGFPDLSALERVIAEVLPEVRG